MNVVYMFPDVEQLDSTPYYVMLWNYGLGPKYRTRIVCSATLCVSRQ